MSSSFVLTPPHPYLSSLYTIQSPISERTKMPMDYINSSVNVGNRLRNTTEILPENAVPSDRPPPPVSQRVSRVPLYTQQRDFGASPGSSLAILPYGFSP